MAERPELLTAEEIAELRLDLRHIHPRDREIKDGTRWDMERIVATLEHDLEMIESLLAKLPPAAGLDTVPVECPHCRHVYHVKQSDIREFTT